VSILNYLSRTRLIALGLGVAALFALSLVFLPHSPSGLRALVGAAGPLAMLAFLALWSLATPAMVSGTLLAAAGGLLFGPVMGATLSIAGMTAGAACAFAIAKLGSGRAVRSGSDGRVARLREGIERRGFRSVLVLRAAPAVPATVVNYAAGLTRVRLGAFVAATAIGGAPRTIAYAVLGSNATHASPLAVALPVAILVGMAILGIALGGATIRSERLRATAAGA
jgi:uncharacterized membrane protein YdjX (TVP38/TMEM64 family)